MDGVRWYADISPTLALEYLAEVETAFTSIAQNPWIYRIRFGDIRRMNTRKFKLAIYFTIHRKDIIVLSVFHPSRDHKKWLQSRRT